MINAYKLRELNNKLKVSLAENTENDIKSGHFSPEVISALSYINQAVEERTVYNGLPYPANMMSFNASLALGNQLRYPELLSVLKNLGFTVSASSSERWGNEQVTLYW
jgi:hypothetical protein